jgi:UDP-glucose 4-epimerase
MYQHLNGIPMTIFGDGLQKRAFSYIDDCLEPLFLSAINSNASKQIINLGGTKEVTIIDACRTLKEVIGAGEIVHLEPRHEVKNAHPTWEKSVSLLNYEDKTTLRDGLSVMWKWAKNQPMRDRFVWGKYEVEKGIYSFWKK